MRPLLLDLFCGAGGAAMGYHQAGFEVVGVDIEPQPRFPFEFHQADALTFPLEGFDTVHASPPCQSFTAYRRKGYGVGDNYPDFIAPVRERLQASGLPYIIENVSGAPLENPIMLCGSSFGLDVQRHRLFESNQWLWALPCNHTWQTPRFPAATNRAANSRRTVEIGVWRIPLETQQQAMGIDWMTLEELSEAIPPAYTQYIGEQLLRHIGTPVPNVEVQTMAEFPYKPVSNGCDICGRSAPLSRVILAEGSRKKLERVAYVCDRHADAAGAPVPVPASRMMPGTSAKHPQQETLM